MRLNSKLTWGLAWAGLALVIAVPSLDAFSGNSAAPALITSDSDQVKVGSTTPQPAAPAPASTSTTPKPGSITINPDGTVVRSAGATSTPATTATEAKTPAAAETKTAVIEPAALPLVAPIPAPASARPKSQSAATTSPPAAAITPPAAQPSQPLVIDEPAPQAETAPIDDPNDLIPPEDIPGDDPAALRAYLEARGLLEPYEGRSTASVQRIDAPADNVSDEYDPDGFYLNDGPNSDRPTKRRSARSGWWYDEYGNLIFY
jgi:hypothetical protein